MMKPHMLNKTKNLSFCLFYQKIMFSEFGNCYNVLIFGFLLFLIKSYYASRLLSARVFHFGVTLDITLSRMLIPDVTTC